MDSFEPSSQESVKEFLKPFGEKHVNPIGQKLKAFHESHPTVDVSPQALLEMNTEQQERLKTEVQSKINWLCLMGSPLTVMLSTLYCTMIYSWNADFITVTACMVS